MTQKDKGIRSRILVPWQCRDAEPWEIDPEFEEVDLRFLERMRVSTAEWDRHFQTLEGAR